MRQGIHPESYKQITVSCSCGHTFTTGSAAGRDLNIEICSKCHPFFTKKQKIVDTARRVDKFQRKYRTGSAENKDS